MLPWWVSFAAGCLTMLGALLVRRLYWQGHLVALINQAFWWWITIATEQWGLVPLSLFLAYNHVRGIVEWRRARVTPRRIAWRLWQHTSIRARSR